MKNIRFTQTIKISVTIEAEVNDWDDLETQAFANDWITNITVSEPDDSLENGTGFTITGMSLEGAEVIDATVWTNH